MLGYSFKMDTITRASTTAEHIIAPDVFDPMCQVHDKSWGYRDPRDNAVDRGGEGLHRANVNNVL